VLSAIISVRMFHMGVKISCSLPHLRNWPTEF
jgi:hypothetical protein